MNAREVTRWLEHAERLRMLRALDLELGHFMLARDGGHPLVALAAALASHAVGQGHACLPLAMASELVAATAPDGAHMPPLPPAADLAAALTASPQCTSDGPALAARTPLWLDVQQRLYITRYARHEARVAHAVTRLVAAAREREPAADDAAWMHACLARFRREAPLAVDGQGVAVLTGLVSPLTVITGSPGTGKTTTVLWLLQALIQYALDHGRSAPRIALAAPTGKAATRLGASLHDRLEAESMDAAVRDAMPAGASTLHRLLGVRHFSTRFRHDHTLPLDADVVVVDEASMVDLPLMARLLDALKPDAHLVLIGDRDQLASVEAGQVLAGICAAAGDGLVSTPRADLIKRVLGADVAATDAPLPLANAVATLRENHRFGPDSGLGQLARAVCDGAAERVCRGLREGAFGGVELSAVADLARHVHAEALPHFVAVAQAEGPAQALELADGMRILTALREGPCGCITINAMLEEALRRRAGVGARERWYAGRLVLVSENDPDAGLFNGDVGVVWSDVHRRLAAWFVVDGELRCFPLSALPAHESAFAMTIHKSQGSEFDAVSIVLPPTDARVLGRELLYTAVTRARQRVHLVASEAVLRTTIGRSTRRYSGLADRLLAATRGPGVDKAPGPG